MNPKPRVSLAYSQTSTTSVTAAAPASPLPSASVSALVNAADSPISPSPIGGAASSPASSAGGITGSVEEDEVTLGKRTAKGRLGGGSTRPRTGGAGGRPKLTSVLMEQEGLRMDQERKMAAERMQFDREMVKEQHNNTMQMLAAIGAMFGGGMGGGGGVMGPGSGGGGMGGGG